MHFIVITEEYYGGRKIKLFDNYADALNYKEMLKQQLLCDIDIRILRFVDENNEFAEDCEELENPEEHNCDVKK